MTFSPATHAQLSNLKSYIFWREFRYKRIIGTVLWENRK